MTHLIRNFTGVCRCVQKVPSVWKKQEKLEVGILPSAGHDRRFYFTDNKMKVCVCGAGGSTGQPLSLLLKQCDLIQEVSLYDDCDVTCSGQVLCQVNTTPQVSAYSGQGVLSEALKGSSIVVILSRRGVNTFQQNAVWMMQLALLICKVCPECFTIVATEPVESMVPIVGEIQRLRGCYNPRKLIGCVELNLLRANLMLASFLRVPSAEVTVPLIGGATPTTMVPVLSSACCPCEMTPEQREYATAWIMSPNCNPLEPSLSEAFAIARATVNVVKGTLGRKTFLQTGYIDCMGCCWPGYKYFSNEFELSPAGITTIQPLPDMTDFERCVLCKTLPCVNREQLRALCMVHSAFEPCNCYRPIQPCYSS